MPPAFQAVADARFLQSGGIRGSKNDVILRRGQATILHKLVPPYDDGLAGRLLNRAFWL